MGEAEAVQDTDPGAAEACFRDRDCPVCDEDPSPEETVLCVRCERPHHLRCWLESKGCAEPGCEERSCRAPGLEGLGPEGIRLHRRSEPRMWFTVFFVAYVVSMYATLFLLPEVLQDSMILTLGVGFLFGCVGLLLVQSLVGKAYHFAPAEGYVFKETRLGPFLWGRPQRWRRFDALTRLDIQLVRRSLALGEEPSYVVQAWIRDASGADLVLREERFSPDSPQLAQARDVARLLEIPLGLVVLGDAEGIPLNVSRITGMPMQAPKP